MSGSEFDDWDFNDGDVDEDEMIIDPEEEAHIMDLKKQFMNDLAEREQKRKRQREA
ncbi:MAG: hypothetical protein LBS92_06145 [Candidatus Methanoplasma sp.]|nr:hypothetical protein [Candidatus Methanoplasma sp.]